MKRLLFLLFLLFHFGRSSAATITVTSNADTGPGTLRAAIAQANTNGTATDHILFNLAGTTGADFTIQLLTELPVLTDHIVIDASSKYIRLHRASPQFFHGLRLDHASNVEIYGIVFSNFKSDASATASARKGAIYLYQSAEITIGAPNKPNFFLGNDVGILSATILPRADNRALNISSNFIGLAVDGITPQPNEDGIVLSYARDIKVEHNIMASNFKSGITLNQANGTIEIINNVIGLDQTLSVSLPSPDANGIYISAENGVPKLTGNMICSQKNGIMLSNVTKGFEISANRVGTSLTDSKSFGNKAGGIIIDHCGAGLIGGTAGANKIAHNEIGLQLEESYPVTISSNNFYCNSEGVVFLAMSKWIEPCRISEISPGRISGTYLPNSSVELFYKDDCPDAGCEGKTSIVKLTTGSTGAWSYDQPVNGPVTSMGTNPDGATTGFSTPYINDFKHFAIKSLCDRKTGEIKDMIIYDADIFEWYDASDETLVSTAKEAKNLAPGIYYLKAYQQGGKCPVYSTTVQVEPKIAEIADQGRKISDENCSSGDGSIRNIIVSDQLKKRWYNADNDSFIIEADDLENVHAGRYYFWLGEGTPCGRQSQIYTVGLNEARYSLVGFDPKKASCGLPNGSLTIHGAPSAHQFTFSWSNARGDAVVGSGQSVTGLPAGNYYVEVQSDYGCVDSFGPFEIMEDPLPAINYTQMQKYLSCDGRLVSTSGIAIDGLTSPYRYRWSDQTGNMISEQLNLEGVLPGVYSLQVVDRNGCKTDGQYIDLTTLSRSAILVPNAFSPNGDGINDTWQIEGVRGYFNAEFSVYSRTGVRVFYSLGYQKPFDGKYNGKVLPTGSYYYVIDLKTDCPKLTGSLTILR